MKTGLTNLSKQLSQIGQTKPALVAKKAPKELAKLVKEVKISSQPSSDQFIKKLADAAKKVK